VEISDVKEKLNLVREAVAEVVVGLEDVVDTLLVALLSEGHVLLEGHPGLGKTTLAKTFAHVLGGEYKRIQMTPDMLPADVLGVNVYNQRTGTWSLRRGPVFTNVVLADELNRASPKVQSAFLEVMQERQVTIEGETLEMVQPFIVLATQVPYGEAGTYPLTNVQNDRFTFKIFMDYLELEDEVDIISRIDSIETANTDPVLEPIEVMDLVKISRSIFVHKRVHQYIVDLVSRMRRNPYVRAGPSPRASIGLMKGGRVRALMDGRSFVIPDDVKTLISNTLKHRIELTPQATVDEVSIDELIGKILEETPVPKGVEEEKDKRKNGIYVPN